MYPISQTEKSSVIFVGLLNSRSRFANVKISSRSHGKMDFRFGFSVESYAKIQNFRSVGTMKPLLTMAI